MSVRERWVVWVICVIAVVGVPCNAAEFIGAPEPAKATKASPLTPDEQRTSFTLPPGFEIELVASESEGIGKFITVDWDQRGRMWSMTAFDYPVDGNENPEAAKALYANPGKDKVLVWDTPFAPGPQTPRIYADGLAIPLGILPYKNGVYVQHGPDIVFLAATDEETRAELRRLDENSSKPEERASKRLELLLKSKADPKAAADARAVVLTGFGVQDSHLFPHQFTRAPGNWIWMAQGAFNSGKVRSPAWERGSAVQFDKTRMARFLPDGRGFEITSQGPCNIWGLVLTGEGEAFIQEANDFGFPVMPFHEGANYPGCSDALFRSFAPEFPGTAPHFKMGGTGLSGLALSDAKGAWPEPYADVMFVANPITRKIQAIKMHREGPRWRMEKLPDFIDSSDEMFRPIAIHFGPDGCLYIVDWYNKIISHNEVPRVHPDRDKTRGRIWRVKHKDQTPFRVPDFTKLSDDELLAKLGCDSTRQSHLAWQAIVDRGDHERFSEKLEAIIRDPKSSDARRIQALWALHGLTGDGSWTDDYPELAKHPNRNVRREVVRMDAESFYTPGEVADWLEPMIEDPDPEVRAEVIRALGRRFFSNVHRDAQGKYHSRYSDETFLDALKQLVRMAKEPLAEPVAPATRNGKPIKVAEAYERDFQRYLIRQTLEIRPDLVAQYLDSAEAGKVPVENRLLAALAMEPKASAVRVAKLLPQITRPPGQEEVLRLAQFTDEPGVGTALAAVLTAPATRTAALEALLAVRTKLDAGKLTPFLADAATALLASKDAAASELGTKLTAAFKLPGTEPALLARAEGPVTEALSALRALAEIGSTRSDVFARLSQGAADPAIRDAALDALAASRVADAPQRVLALHPTLTPAQRRRVIEKLTSTKSGATALVAAVGAGTLPLAELDGASIDRLQVVLGHDDPALAKLVETLGDRLRPVLTLDGSDDAFSVLNLGHTLYEAFTVETWVRLDPAKAGRKLISNTDGILGAPGELDINFFDAKLRVWAGPQIQDAIISKKAITPGLWTHVAVTRDAAGSFKIYHDGELAADQSKRVEKKFPQAALGWTGTAGGTSGAFAEYRIWQRERTADEIRGNFDRGLPDDTLDLAFNASGDNGWGELHQGARVVKTSDFPPILTADEAVVLDSKFAKYRALAEQPGDLARGKASAAICISCHLVGREGGNIGPNLSGVGAMGTEAILRNILTPNAAMEAGYRIYRVEMKNGDVIDSFFVSENPDAVVIRMPGADDQRISRKEIARTTYLRRSLMPEGLLDTMTSEQVSDLFTYLKTLK